MVGGKGGTNRKGQIRQIRLIRLDPLGGEGYKVSLFSFVPKSSSHSNGDINEQADLIEKVTKDAAVNKTQAEDRHQFFLVRY